MAELDCTTDIRFTTRMPNLTGRTFGYLTVERLVSGAAGGKRVWLCTCSRDGNKTTAKTSDLVRGHKKSCGCIHGRGQPKHGMRRRLEYFVWGTMIQRCENPNNRKYVSYGGRGIVVCERWRHSFSNFYSDMGPRPTAMHQLDRVDNDGPYSPDNCRWATCKENNQHTRRSRRVTFRGKSLSIPEWSVELGIHRDCLCYRLRAGWSVDKTMTTPPNVKCRKLSHR